MNKEVIAVVRLAPGEAAYFDELSRIHLTIGNPQRQVFAGTNCTNLRRSVKYGTLLLLSGSLGEAPQKAIKSQNRTVMTPAAKAPLVSAKPEVKPEPIIAEPVLQPAVEEQKDTEAVPPIIAEEAPIIEQEITEDAPEQEVKEPIEEKKGRRKRQ